MNFQVQVSKERLDKTLGILKHALERRVTLPILQHVLVEVKEQEMTLKATDMELAFEAVIPVEGKGNRVVAIPGKKFIETVRVYTDGLLTLEWPNTIFNQERVFQSYPNQTVPCPASKCLFIRSEKPSSLVPFLLAKMLRNLHSPVFCSIFRRASSGLFPRMDFAWLWLNFPVKRDSRAMPA
jgi:DNA polymerase III beta subunit, N-terminal domain